MYGPWQEFLGRLGEQAPMRSVIVESWERCRLAGMKPGDLDQRRLGDDELKRRLQRDAELVSVGTPHLDWLLLSAGALKPVAVMLTDRDGVILASRGNVPEMLTQYGLVPGYDWSEASMGTNGIGTALATAQPVAILGPEHYLEAIHDYTCVGAPIVAADGTVLGALDLCTRAQDGDPTRLVLTAYAARTIARELASMAVARAPATADDDLLAVAAHEMKTPLTTLLMLARALRHATDPSVLPSLAIERFEKQVQRLVDLTTGILDVAQLKTNAAMEREELDLAQVVRELAAALEERGLEPGEPHLLRVQGPESLVGRWAPRRVRAIVTNLLSNALKYGNGQPVDVAVEQRDGAARVVVRDRGIGIPAKEQERIFQRFSRSDAASRKFPGHGLGLWIASELARSMGGKVELLPTEGAGTTFAVTLPLS